MDYGAIVLGLLIFGVFVTLVIKGFLIVEQAETMIVERLGTYRRTLKGGPHVIWPFIEKPRPIKWKFDIIDPKTGEKISIKKDTIHIDLREIVYDFPRQPVITEDNVPIDIDGILFFNIIDPYRAVYQVANLPEAIEKLTEVTLRDVIGGLELDETLRSREEINMKMQSILGQSTARWGVRINRVELQDIIPPEDVRMAMKKQMTAERSKRATVIEAEGKKNAAVLIADGEREAAIKMAEGERQATVLRASGEADARYKVAQSEAESIRKLIEVIGNGKNSSSYMATLKYIDAFKELINKSENKVVFVPYEATTILSSLGMIKEILGDVSGKQLAEEHSQTKKIE